MLFDFSVFKDIDFTNRENLISLFIFLVIAGFILWIFIVIVVLIVTLLKKFIVRESDDSEKNSQFGNQGNVGSFKGSQSIKEFGGLSESKEVKEDTVKKMALVQGAVVISSDIHKKQSIYKKESEMKAQEENIKKDIAENYAKLKINSSSEEKKAEAKMPADEKKQADDLSLNETKMPQRVSVIGSFVHDSADSDKKSEQDDKKGLKTYKEKEEKSILEHLSKLKVKDEEGKETLESKMPSRDPEEDEGYKKIKIPRAKRFKTEKKEDKNVVVTSSSLHGQKLVYEKEKIEGTRETLKKQNKGFMGLIKDTLGINKDGSKNSSSSGSSKQAKGGYESNHGRGTTNKEYAVNDGIKIPTADKRGTEKKGGQDYSIFGDKEEISRLEFKHKLRFSKDVWRAGVKSRFNLSPLERVSLEKDLFSNFITYGRNISKDDLKLRLKLMNKERFNAGGKGNYVKQEKLRREINFLKKIGGIK